MTQKNIAAWTHRDSQPQYISVNQVPARDGEVVEIIVRGPALPNGDYGPIACIRMTPDEWDVLLMNALRNTLKVHR